MKALFVVIVLLSGYCTARKAVITVPVANAALHSLAKYKGDIEALYDNFVLAPDKKHEVCLRLHQLKFNEVVTITDTREAYNKKVREIECEVSNLYYLDTIEKKRNRFWLLETHVVPLDTLPRGIDKAHIPAPVDMKKASSQYNKNVLTLIEPWHDSKMLKTYSAGTRFVRCSEEDTGKEHAFYIPGFDEKSEHIAHISKKSAVVDYPKTPSGAVALFLKIIKKWAKRCDRIVPYVFGGCSFTESITPQGFFLTSKKGDAYWHRNGFSENLFCGFDCSSVILCAAQIVGMPYFCKNTLALLKSLRPLKADEKIEEGDLVWYSGHVLVVSDVKSDMLIEAAGYEKGYGRIHEIHISKVFRGIATCKELIQAYHGRRFLKRLDHNQQPAQSVYRLKILKLRSIWEG